ncbi:DUF3310 domain-containing protein [Bifidobacterium eulemuris]|nr:DUF3310 domain-containing protein [Bifidobacterium eulemuris]
MGDPVNHPEHYELGPFECIELSGLYDFCLGNAVKYVWRHRHKGQPMQDLNKALWYLRRERMHAGPNLLAYMPEGGCSEMADKFDMLRESHWAGADRFWTALENDDLEACIQAVEQLIKEES